MLTALISSKIVLTVAAVVGVAGIGGTAAASCTGTLPTPLQQQAHALVGAPAPATVVDAVATEEVASTVEGDGAASTGYAPTTAEDAATTPDVSDDTAAAEADGTDDTEDPTTVTRPVRLVAHPHGLCTAWTSGGIPVTSVAYARLSATAAAAGAADLSGFCAPYLTAKPHHTKPASDDSADETETETETRHAKHENDGTAHGKGHGRHSTAGGTASEDEADEADEADDADETQQAPSDSQDTDQDEQDDASEQGDD